MDRFQVISEDHIKRAYREGEFDHLPGKGKPLPKDDLAAVPEELRMAYRLLKNAGYTEEESNLRKEVTTLENLINKCQDDEERKRYQQKLNEKLLRWNQMNSKKGTHTNSAIFKNYDEKITSKLAGKPKFFK